MEGTRWLRGITGVTATRVPRTEAERGFRAVTLDEVLHQSIVRSRGPIAAADFVELGVIGPRSGRVVAESAAKRCSVVDAGPRATTRGHIEDRIRRLNCRGWLRRRSNVPDSAHADADRGTTAALSAWAIRIVVRRVARLRPSNSRPSADHGSGRAPNGPRRPPTTFA